MQKLQIEIQNTHTSFKSFNKFMLLMWRLGFGKWLNAWPSVGGQFLVINHTGRKSGLRRQTPVNYAVVDGEVYCTAGYGKGSDWYQNLKANPAVDVWMAEGWWSGFAEDVTGCPDQLQLMRAVLIGSGFAAKMIAGVDPHTMSDEALEQLTRDYRLIHIQRKEARTGEGGPGDLAWVWPVTTAALAVLLLARPRRRR